MSRRIGFIALVGFVLVAAGCGQSGPSKLDVSGTIKFEGQDVTDGFVTFLPEDKAIGPESAPIKDGKYAAKVVEGKNKVQIQANRLVPGKKGPMGEPAVEQYIPKKYNEQTTLSADVSRSKTEHNFDLTK